MIKRLLSGIMTRCDTKCIHGKCLHEDCWECDAAGDQR